MKELACLCHKGGVPLINHLIKFVYSLDEDGNKSKHKLDIFKVQEWQYRDIVKIKDPDICKEFKCICQDELEALWQRETFEEVEWRSITKPTIKCRWVFDVKPDR